MSELTGEAECADLAARFVVLSTAPDDETAGRLADLLVGKRLAACVNVVPGLVSHYWWDGRAQRDREWMLIVKTDRRHLAAVIATIEQEHPYDCPEAVALPIVAGSAAYLGWIGAAMSVPANRDVE